MEKNKQIRTILQKCDIDAGGIKGASDNGTNNGLDDIDVLNEEPPDKTNPTRQSKAKVESKSLRVAGREVRSRLSKIGGFRQMIKPVSLKPAIQTSSVRSGSIATFLDKVRGPAKPRAADSSATGAKSQTLPKVEESTKLSRLVRLHNWLLPRGARVMPKLRCHERRV